VVSVCSFGFFHILAKVRLTSVFCRVRCSDLGGEGLSGALWSARRCRSGRGALLQKWFPGMSCFFSRGGCKCTPLLQQELDTVAFRPPLEMHLQGRVTAPPAPENRARSDFQGRLVPSAAPGNVPYFPPPDRTVLSRGRCCPNFSCIINRGRF